MDKINSYKKYYSYSFEDLYKEDLILYGNEREAKASAKSRLRMYANLFNRDCRKLLLNKKSECVVCKSKEKLTIDHIIPVTKGGKNEIENVSILCNKCNILKSNK